MSARFAAAIVGACFLSLGCDSPSGPIPPLDGCVPEHEAVRSIVLAQLEAVQVADASVVIRARGQAVCRLILGTHRTEPAVTIESAAKWLTAATVLAASDRGMLQLPTRTGEVWPATPVATREITVAQLLSHTSGLLWFSRCVGRSSHTLRECAEAILEGDSHFEPGAGFFYSSPPFTVAAAMVEERSQTNWHRAFGDWIGAPLRLTKTSYGTSANPSLADGGVQSSADDYSAFLEMILNGGVGPAGRVLSQAAVDSMRRPRNLGLKTYASPRPGGLYGLGSWVDSVNVDGIAVVLSSPGSRGFVPIVDFGRRMTFVFAVDADIGKVSPAITAILAAARASIDR